MVTIERYSHLLGCNSPERARSTKSLASDFGIAGLAAEGASLRKYAVFGHLQQVGTRQFPFGSAILSTYRALPPLQW